MDRRPFRSVLGDVRLWLLLIPALAVLAIDLPVMMTLLYAMSAMLVVAGFSHLIRRVFFPYVDLEQFVVKAHETATGAGYVVLGVSIVIASFIIGSAVWLSK